MTCGAILTGVAAALVDVHVAVTSLQDTALGIVSVDKVISTDPVGKASSAEARI
jgi:hypothetical protein